MAKNLLNYFAGFIDGEGTISMYQHTGRRRIFEAAIRLSVVNTNKASLRRLQKTFGGSINPMHTQNKAYGQKWKPSFIWTLGAKATADALKLLQPYLFIKRKQCLLALQARQLVRCRGRRLTQQDIKRIKKFLIKFRTLNKKGMG